MRARFELDRVAGGAHEVAQDGHVGAIGANAARIHGQAEALGKIQIDAGIIQFGETETLRWQDTVDSRRIHGTRRAVPVPRPPCQLIKLLPIAFVPGRHFLTNRFAVQLLRTTLSLLPWMLEGLGRFLNAIASYASSLEAQALPAFRPPRYCTFSRARQFPCLVFQTRKGVICLAANPGCTQCAARAWAG